MLIFIRLLIDVAIMAAVILFLARGNKVKTKIRGFIVAFAVIAGFSMYSVGYIPPDAGFTDTLWAVLRGMLHTARMFSLTDNYTTVIGSPGGGFLKENAWWQLLFWFCHLTAASASIYALISVFGKDLINNVRVWLHAHLALELPLMKPKTQYIVVGCGKAMKVFLKDFQNPDGRKKTVNKDYITIITGDTDGEDSVYKKLVDDGFAIIKGEPDEKALKKAGANKPRRSTKVIAISENDELNLKTAVIIAQTITSSELPDDKIKLEAYVMYSFIERTEYFTFAESAYGKIHFFNPYELRVREFFIENPITGMIPDLIDTDKARLKGELSGNGKIIKPDGGEYRIKHIFAGFGASNYQMLKGSVLTEQLFGCDYNAIIYDENISEEKPSLRQEIFMNQSGGLFPGGYETVPGEKYLESPKENYNIIFKHGNVLTKSFYADLLNEIKDDDFTAVYISLDEDKMSVETACELRQFLYEHGIVSNKKARIFVKTHENSVFNDELVLNNKDSVINYNGHDALKIQCFGFDNSVLTKENIINEKLDEFAIEVTNKNHDKEWGELPEIKRNENRQVAMAIRTKLNLLGFNLSDSGNTNINRPVAGDDYYNKYAGTDMDNEKIAEIIELSKLSGIGDKKAKEKLKKSHTLNYLQTENGEPDGKICDTPRNNLARLEHLRWNTFQLIYGWSKMPVSKIASEFDKKKNKYKFDEGRKDKYTKQHACITTFEDLILLRTIQAEKTTEKQDIKFVEAEAQADTIWYDFNTMDELPSRLKNKKWGIMMNVKICGHCDRYYYAEEDKYCRICGTERGTVEFVPTPKVYQIDKTNTCGDCWRTFREGEEFCRFCGTKRGEGSFTHYTPWNVQVRYQCPKCGLDWIEQNAMEAPQFCRRCGDGDLIATYLKEEKRRSRIE